MHIYTIDLKQWIIWITNTIKGAHNIYTPTLVLAFNQIHFTPLSLSPLFLSHTAHTHTHTMEKVFGLGHLFMTVFLYCFANFMVVPAITDVTMGALCPGKDECSLAIYLTGAQQAVRKILLFFNWLEITIYILPLITYYLHLITLWR